MESTKDGYEQAARIVEAFAEAEEDERVLELLTDIAKAIREKAIND